MRTVLARAGKAAMVAIALAIAACTQTGPAFGPPTADTAATVEMSGLSFGPATVRIKAGDTVEWRNKSSFTHSVNADPARFPQDVAIPTGAAPFDSGRIASGGIYRHRFTTPGTYKYVCLPHVDLGMTAAVIVEPR